MKLEIQQKTLAGTSGRMLSRGEYCIRELNLDADSGYYRDGKLIHTGNRVECLSVFNEKVWQHGYVACSHSVEKSDNPYKAGEQGHNEWLAGWLHYDADYNPNYYDRFECDFLE